MGRGRWEEKGGFLCIWQQRMCRKTTTAPRCHQLVKDFSRAHSGYCEGVCKGAKQHLRHFIVGQLYENTASYCKSEQLEDKVKSLNWFSLNLLIGKQRKIVNE